MENKRKTSSRTPRVRPASLALRASLALALFGCALTAPPVIRAEATPGVQPQVERPNVLLIVTDDQRNDTFSVMPGVRRLFGKQGTRFPETYAATPLCCPSRASIMTGRYSHTHRVYNNGEDAVRSLDHSRTIQSQLDDAGYRTGIIGKYFNDWPTRLDPPGFDRWAISDRGYYDAVFNVQGRTKTVSQYVTDYISDQAVSFIRDSSEEEDPWFLYLAPLAPHGPFAPEPAYANAPIPAWKRNPAMLEKDLSDKPAAVQAPSVNMDDKRVRSGQLRSLMSVDDMVERIFGTLDDLGEADNTLAIYTSDNGFYWQEHGLTDKRLPYTQAMKLPLFMRWPEGIEAGAVDERLVSNVDLAPTILDAAQVQPRDLLDGESLLHDGTRTTVFSEYWRDVTQREIREWAALRTDEYQYTEYYDDDGKRIFREYYDLTNDPWQLNNVLADRIDGNEPSAEILAELSTRLQIARRCEGTSCLF
jgi:arylsulfatase A-like enzyme